VRNQTKHLQDMEPDPPPFQPSAEETNHAEVWQMDIADDANAQSDAVNESDFKRGQRFQRLFATLANPLVCLRHELEAVSMRHASGQVFECVDWMCHLTAPQVQRPIVTYRNRACIMVGVIMAAQVASFVVMSSLLDSIGGMVLTLTEFGKRWAVPSVA
jgi:hypothetical protein